MQPRCRNVAFLQPRGRPHERDDDHRWGAAAAASGAVDEITSPWDGRVVGTVPRAGPADADAAVAAAVDGAVVVAAHARPRAAAHPPARGRPRRRAHGGDRRTDQRGEREVDPRGDRRGLPLRRRDPHVRVRGRPPLRRVAAAGRRPRHRLRQDRLHRPPALRGRAGDHPVQLSGPARDPQDRARARRGQRRRPQAGRAHPADRAGPRRLLPRGGPAGTRALGRHRARQRDRRRAGGRPARPQGLVHRARRRWASASPAPPG